MTTKQKIIGIAALGGLVVLIAFLLSPIRPFRPPTPQHYQVQLLTTSAGTCDANPRKVTLIQSRGDTVRFAADPKSAFYQVDFSTRYPFTSGSNPIRVPSTAVTQNFTAAPVSATTYAPYTLTNANNCKQVIEDIGIIIQH